MNAIFEALSKFFFPTNEPRMAMVDGFKQEAETLQQKREDAKRRMKEIGRKSLIEGGEFNLNNKVLNKIGNAR